MTLTEKVVLAIIIICTLLVTKSCYDFQQLIIETGKAVKEINQEIEEYEPRNEN